MKILKDKNDVIKLRIEQLKIHENVEKIPINALKTISINPTELCNRKCHFCPRSDPKIYSNQKLHMSETTIRNLSKELKKIKYNGSIMWSGFGEPLLTKNFLELTKVVKNKNPQLSQLINTNGDCLRPKKIKELYDAGIDYMIVSLYDGPEQLEKTKKKFEGIDESKYSLRISYYHSNNFENFSNRAGAVNVNIERNKSHIKNKCFWPFYKMVIDWDGGILLCCEDWFKISKAANKFNINTHSIEEIWDSEFFNDYRKYLKDGKRIKPICNKCNVHGEKIGKEFVEYYDV